ncbi:BLUF domain-containing protein [Methylobacterium sp. ID0610]|uniref:BLUF domain-containing protein n=1 Tax=Methylobacterium carpenticola TaxID=3344827 RepID=UPI00369DA676
MPGIIAAILAAARARNAAAGVPGVLVYTGHGFLQVPEGPRSAAPPIFESILVDRRASPELDRGLNRSGPAPGLVGEQGHLAEILRRALLILVDAPISLPRRRMEERRQSPRRPSVARSRQR